MSAPTIKVRESRFAVDKPPPPPRRRRGRRSKATLFVLPGLTLLLCFQAVPFLLTTYYSFTDQRLVSARPTKWIGLSNYENIFTDPGFLRTMWNSLIFTAVAVPILTALALALALLINSQLRGIGFFRMALFAPVIMVAAVSATIWRLLFAQDSGLVNGFIGAIWPWHQDIAWLDNPETALPAVMVMFIWRYAGFMMVIFLAALQSVSQDLLECSRLDGANPWQQFRHVILPQIRNSSIFVVTISTIFALRLFDEVYVATSGGPLNSTSTFLVHLVKVGFEQQRVGEASAIATVFVAITILIALIIRVVGNERREVD